jgi:hypothetical protein
VVDTYSTTYLQYGYGGVYSVPASNDNTDDGTLNWSNVSVRFATRPKRRPDCGGRKQDD